MDRGLRELQRRSLTDPGARAYWIRRKASLATWDASKIFLMGASTRLVKEGNFSLNHYAHFQEEGVVDLGEDIEVFFIKWRPKAISHVGEIITVSHDLRSNTFKEIMKAADGRHYNNRYGPEYLVFLPHLERYGTIFCSSRGFKHLAEEIVIGQCKILSSVTAETHTGITFQVPKFKV